MNQEHRVYSTRFTPSDVTYRSPDGLPEPDEDGNILDLTIMYKGYLAIKTMRQIVSKLEEGELLSSGGGTCIGFYPPGVEMYATSETVGNITMQVLESGAVTLDVLRDNGGRYEVPVPMEEITNFFNEE